MSNCDGAYYTNYGNYMNACVLILGNDIFSGMNSADAYNKFIISIQTYPNLEQDLQAINECIYKPTTPPPPPPTEAPSTSNIGIILIIIVGCCGILAVLLYFGIKFYLKKNIDESMTSFEQFPVELMTNAINDSKNADNVRSGEIYEKYPYVINYDYDSMTRDETPIFQPREDFLYK